MQETKLEVGAIFEGKVTGITKFGAFVDLGHVGRNQRGEAGAVPEHIPVELRAVHGRGGEVGAVHERAVPVFAAAGTVTVVSLEP